jgi:predicted peroxiredoxin
MTKSAWGAADETRASFVFNHGLALASAGHEIQIFLLGDATVLTRKVVAGCSHRLASNERNFRKARGGQNSGVRLRRVQPFAWRNRSRLYTVGFKFGNPTIL